jgi:hypothetical protein
MSIVTKVALAIAIVVVVTADVYLSFGTTVPGQTFASVSRPVGRPADYLGDPHKRWERKCWAGSCSPDWGSDS